MSREVYFEMRSGRMFTCVHMYFAPVLKAAHKMLQHACMPVAITRKRLRYDDNDEDDARVQRQRYGDEDNDARMSRDNGT